MVRARWNADEEYDVVVIGSGIGGLSCGALLSKYGYKVKVFESHYLAGGCCHMFDHRAPDGSLYKFEVGPSIWEGLDRPTGNPLRMVFDALGEEVPVKEGRHSPHWPFCTLRSRRLHSACSSSLLALKRLENCVVN